MSRRAVFARSMLFGLVLSPDLRGQQIRLSDAELAAITERGRELADYDQAAWHATDALQMANPKTAEGQRCLARFEKGKWVVAFGSLNGDKSKFLIRYQALERDKPQDFALTHHDPPFEDPGFYLYAARALEMSLGDFGGTSLPYSAAVLPASEGQLYVYLYPAQTQPMIYPFGGDVRYLVSPDGTKILEKRQLHKTILETKAALNGGKVAAGRHTHSLSDLPEDTDVLHVLQQSPPVPEMVFTPHFTYEVERSGTIRIRKEKKK